MPGRGGKRAGAGRKSKTVKKAPENSPDIPAPTSQKLPLEDLFLALPLKQQHFISNYFANGFNATQAAIDAGFGAKNADTQAARLLVNVSIKLIIAARSEHLLKRKEITADFVLAGIASLASFDIRKMFYDDGLPRSISELGPAEAMAITGIDVLERTADDGTVIRLKKIRLADRGINFERLGKYLKLFTQKVEHSGSLGVQLISSVPRPQRKPVAGGKA